MWLDDLVDERDTQIVDRDADTGNWGLTADIDVSTRGRIPDSTRKLLKRAEDEQIRLSIAAGYDRPTVADIFDFSYRTAWRKERRAHAFQLPLTVLYRRNRPSASGLDPGAVHKPGQEQGHWVTQSDVVETGDVTLTTVRTYPETLDELAV